ncbi:MAG: energy transducer TonB [Pseudomonadota bacterium]
MAIALRESHLAFSFRWSLVALVIAVMLHGIAAVFFFYTSERDVKGQSNDAGIGGIEISLGPAGRSQGGQRTQEGRNDEPIHNVPAIEEIELIEVVEPKPKITPDPIIEPVPIPVEKTSKEPPRETFKKKEVVEDALVQKTIPPPQPAEQPQATNAQQSTIAGNDGKSGTTEYEETGSGDDTAGGGSIGNTQNYASELLSWLQRHKEYPRRARMRRQEGTVLLYFKMNADGEVLEFNIKQSSGFSTLDKEALKMIQRAQPLPAIPSFMNKDSLELVVPVEFFLR